MTVWRPRGRRAVFVGLVLAFVLPVFCSGAPPVASNLHDIIFLIDQSGSMSRYHGPGGSWAPNDPRLGQFGHRQGAILQTFDLLQGSLKSKRDPGVMYRVRVVEFGDGAVARQPIALRYDPANPVVALDTSRRALEGELRLPPPPDEQTDTRAGLQETLKWLGSATPDHTHVVLITDGKPYVEQGGGNVAGSPSYVSDLMGLATAIAGRASLDVIGIIGPESRPQYWPEWGRFWAQASGGRADGVRTAQEVSTRVEEIVNSWLNLPPPRVVKTPYQCPPYLESIVFMVFKSRPGEGAEIVDPGGRKIVSGLPGVQIQNESTYDRISIENPNPGPWMLDRSAFRITATPFYRKIQRIQPRSAVNIAIPFRFSYQVQSAGGQPFHELPDYPVSATLEVAEPGSAPTLLKLTHTGNGVFGAGQDFELKTPGVAALRFKATAPVDGKDVEVFGTAETLQVTAKDLLVLDAGGSLPTGAGLRFGRLRLSPSLRVHRFAGDSALVPLAEVSRRPGDLIEYRLVRSDGTEIEGWKNWRKLSPAGAEELSGEAPFSLPLFSWDWGLRRPQDLFFEVRVNESALNPRFAVRELARDAGPDGPEGFDQDRALPMLLSNPLALPLTAREPLSTYVLTILIAGIAVLLALYILVYLLRFAAFFISDWLRKRTVVLVIQPTGGSDLDGVRKVLTGKVGWSSHKPAAVGIRFGEDPDNPVWRPRWLRVRRLFRPWDRRVLVRVSYPVPAGNKDRTYHTVIAEKESPRRLDGMDEAEAYLIIRIRGRLTSGEEALAA
jgi:hypothetical protein